jgi:hypothetical protein
VPDLDQLIKSRQAAVEAQSARSGRPVQVRAESARARLKYDLGCQRRNGSSLSARPKIR